MSYGNGIKLTAGFDVGAKTPLDSKSVVQTIAERDAFVTDNLVYEGLEVYVKDTGHKYRYNGTSWIDLDTQSGSESGTGEGLTTEQANQLTTAYEHSQTPHVSADDIPTNISDLTNDSGFITSSDLPTVPTKVSDLENDRGYLISIPEEYITETELEAKGYLTSHQDISNLQSKTDNNLATTSKEVVGAINEVKSSVDGITVPTKTSDLTNDSGFITSIPSEYITETELETKGYLTEHQSLTDYAKKTDIPDVSDFLTEVPEGYVTDTKLSTELDKKVNKEVGKGLSTNDLTNELVTKINSSATEAFVTNAIANAQLGDKEVDLSGYATVDALKLKADLTHTHDQYLTKVPDEYITETELTDKNYADKTYVTQAVSNVKVDLTGYAKTSDIPTKTSDLNNDSGFIGYPNVIVIDKGDMDAEVDLDNDIPLGRNTILLTGRVVYNTYGHELVFVYRDRESSDSFTIYTMKGDKVVVNKSNGNWNITSSTSFIYRDNANSLYQKITDNTLTTTAKTIPTAINELKSGLDGIKVPINISELNNDSGYLTSIPEEYITETELTAKGYLTEHQDISNLALKSEIPDVSSFITSDDLPIVPTKVSDLANDKNYISSIPSEYVTETELTAKKYLTSVPSTYALKTDIPTVPTKTSDLTNDSGYLSTKDITSTINSTSSDTQIPTAKSVNVAIKGKLITQEDIDAYGKEIIKFPVGKWTIGSVAISNLTDLPNSYVRYIEIIGISEATNPWTNNNTLRSYKAISYKGDTFLRSLNSGSEAGVIAFDTGWQRVLLNGDIIDNLTSTDTNKLLSANQGKILNDTKLNKTDANKLNCVTIDNVSLKEYILTNFTGTEKTYYLIAKTTCTDLPKASNFYITVETPGMYTYKVTAKELNDSNGIYVCTYRTISSTWTEWEKVLITRDITTTISDSSTDTQVPSAKAVYDELQEVFQSVSNGKNLIASAITDKGVETLADATFKQMADNIEKISGGSETIPIANEVGIIDYNTSRKITIDISKKCFVITGLNISGTSSISRMAQYSVINGEINTIIQSSSTYCECSITENKLMIRNTNTEGYKMYYTVIEM